MTTLPSVIGLPWMVDRPEAHLVGLAPTSPAPRDDSALVAEVVTGGATYASRKRCGFDATARTLRPTTRRFPPGTP